MPVILDPLDDLPESFDMVGATLENAALLQRAGVKIAFSLTDTSPHNIRKVRQAAGIAVAHGLPAEDALAALTRNPAEIFGVADRNGYTAARAPGGPGAVERRSAGSDHARRCGVHPGGAAGDELAPDGTSRPLSA